MENIERRRARCRAYGKAHREELSAYRANRYRTNEIFRNKCKEASKKYYEKRKRGEI